MTDKLKEAAEADAAACYPHHENPTYDAGKLRIVAKGFFLRGARWQLAALRCGTCAHNGPDPKRGTDPSVAGLIYCMARDEYEDADFGCKLWEGK